MDIWQNSLSLPWEIINHRKGCYSCCNPPMTGKAVSEGTKQYWPGGQGSLRKGTRAEYLFQTCIGHPKWGKSWWFSLSPWICTASFSLISISGIQIANSLGSIYVGVKTLPVLMVAQKCKTIVSQSEFWTQSCFISRWANFLLFYRIRREHTLLCLSTTPRLCNTTEQIV